jgi:hypothetical protein
MEDRRDSFQLVSIADAVRILNVSDSTVRRLMRAGRLEAQRVERPQGHVWLVKVPAPTTDQVDTSSSRLGAADGHPPEAPGAPTPQPPALAAWMSSVLEPLVTELHLSRETLTAQAERLGYVTAERDTARADLERAAATMVALGDELERLRAPATEARTAPHIVNVPEEAPSPRWRLWGPWLLTSGTLIVVVLLLAWPR